MKAIVLLCAIVSTTMAAPEAYWGHASSAVQAMHQQSRRLNQAALSSYTSLCGEDSSNGTQRMWFTENDCSVASQDVTFMFNETLVIEAKKGDIIPWDCEDVFCPTPAVPDCYRNPKICAHDEWCWVKQHERWGPWAMDTDERTPDEAFCGQDLEQMIAKNAALTQAEIQAINATYMAQCSGMHLRSEDYKGLRGQCVKYRKEDQSCLANEIRFEDSLGFNPSFRKNEKGNAFVRPLVCDPRTHECTGPAFDVLPNTCVPKRPRDICYFGPWWNSTTCLRTEGDAPKGGLSEEQARRAAAVSLLLYPGEVMSAANCTFWDRTTSIGLAVEQAREQIYTILGALWPQQLFGMPPTMEELMDLLPTPYKLPGGLKECYEEENIEGSPAATSLHDLKVLADKPNMVWSLVHFVMHNQPPAMSYEAVQASRALAVFLTENFWCTDCRSFFAVGVVQQYGLPPQSFYPHEHAKWWHQAHNVASEHIAAHRGGHPWIHQLGAEDVASYQNPFYMSWEDAVKQWTFAL